MDRDPNLSGLWVRGEISNFKWHTSGHIYFTLKDEYAQLKCVMFRTAAGRLRFRPEGGMQVLAFGNITVYDRDGAYQMYVDEMEPAGLGALHMQYEQLKKKLAAEGLFDEAHKRPLPALPRKVGIITAATGAALRDMLTVSRRRFPGIHLVVVPAQVQGAEAAPSLIRALGLVAQVPEIDVVIMGRGGGSLEDLWAFNDEALARAIRACPIPVVSAVGHETDFTIADLAADLRAPTPSAAAELVVPSRSELAGQLEGLRMRLARASRRIVERKRSTVEALRNRPVLLRPQGRLMQDRQRLDDLTRRLAAAGARLLPARRQRTDELIHRLGFAGGRIAGEKEKRLAQLAERLTAAGARMTERRRLRLTSLAGRLDALSPLAVLSRGYAIARGPDGHILKETAGVSAGQRVEVMLHKGRLTTRVESVWEES